MRGVLWARRHEQGETRRLLTLPVALIVSLAVLGLAGCGSTPPPSTTPSPPPPSTAPPAPSSPPAAIPVHVRFAGPRLNCVNNFPYSCTATLSLVPAGTAVPDEWRPSAADPWWVPGDPSRLLPGPRPRQAEHRLVVSVLGTYDVPSYSSRTAAGRSTSSAGAGQTWTCRPQGRLTSSSPSPTPTRIFQGVVLRRRPRGLRKAHLATRRRLRGVRPHPSTTTPARSALMRCDRGPVARPRRPRDRAPADLPGTGAASPLTAGTHTPTISGSCAA